VRLFIQTAKWSLDYSGCSTRNELLAFSTFDHLLLDFHPQTDAKKKQSRRGSLLCRDEKRGAI